jgi:hypothetical protein
MKIVGALVAVVGATSACGGDCVDCALPSGNRGFLNDALTPITAAAPGEVWWFAGTADTWLLDGLPLEVAATTPSWTAVRVPADAASGTHTVVANVETPVFVAEPDPAATVVLPTDLALVDGRQQTIYGCGSTCFDTPFETVQTTEYDGFAWTTQLTGAATPLILVDVWGPDDDVDDELAPRLGDSIPLPDNWLTVDDLVLQALPGETSVTVRLRSLLDASTGPQSRAE